MCLTDAVNVKLYSRCESVETIHMESSQHAGVAVRKCANSAADYGKHAFSVIEVVYQAAEAPNVVRVGGSLREGGSPRCGA